MQTATNFNTLELSLPSVVRFHYVPAQSTQEIARYAPALSFHQQVTTEQALNALREVQSDAYDIHYLFVTDASERLVGFVSLHELISAAPGARLFEIMDRDVLTLSQGSSLRDQARMMSESGWLALPVVDEDGRLIGAMDACDMIRVTQEETTAEMYGLVGLRNNEQFGQMTAFPSPRILWLLLGLPFGILVTWLLRSGIALFGESTLSILMTLLPFGLILGLQAGWQTLTLAVRSLNLAQISRRDSPILIWHELLGGLVNGSVAALATGLLVMLWLGQIAPGVLIGLAVFLSIVLATTIAAGVPLLLKTTQRRSVRPIALLVPVLIVLSSLGCSFGLMALATQMGYIV